MKSKRILSLLISLFILLSLIPQTTILAAGNVTVSILSATHIAGRSVDIDINIENNPGILGGTLKFTYDSSLLLTNAVAGDAFSALSLTKPGKFTSPCSFTWDGQQISQADIKNGTILTLTFEIPKDAQPGTIYNITASCENGGFVDTALKKIVPIIINGKISVDNYLVGDLNSDNTVDASDIILLRRHIVGGYTQTINEKVYDINNDGNCNIADIVLLRRHITGGYPEADAYFHRLTYTPKKDSTCTESGNKEYWYCSVCDKYYSDIEATNEVKLSDTVIKAKGHTLEHIAKKSATYTESGNKEYWHCTSCDKYFTDANATNEDLFENLIVDKLEDKMHNIKYENLKGASESGLTKKFQETKGCASFGTPGEIAGYTFVGWYTELDGGMKITGIPEYTKEDVTVYAHWVATRYSISYHSGQGINSASNPDTYTTEDDITLEGCKSTKISEEFDYWKDKKGDKIYNLLGLTRNLDLTAMYKYASQRNQIYPYDTMEKPLFKRFTCVQNDENPNIYYLSYYLGRVNNVMTGIVIPSTYFSGLKQEEHIWESIKEIEDKESKEKAKVISETTSLVNSWEETAAVTADASIEASASTKVGIGFAEASTKITSKIAVSAGLEEKEIQTQAFTSSSTESYKGTISRSSMFEESTKYSLSSDADGGWYRCIEACNVDVFGIIEYDAIKNTYGFDLINIPNGTTSAIWEYSKNDIYKTMEEDAEKKLYVSKEEISEQLIKFRQPVAEKYGMTVEELAEFTIYDSFEDTPSNPTKKSIIDWSEETGTTYAQKNIIFADNSEVYLYGNGTTTFPVSITLPETASKSDIHISNFKCTGNDDMFISNNRNNDINIYVDGNCEINSVLNLPNSNINIYGSGTLTIKNDNFDQSTLLCKNLHIYDSVKLKVYGKDGVNGSNGANAENGTDGCIAVECSSNFTADKNTNLFFVGGNGGNGGNGTDSAIWLQEKDYAGGNGGNGGNGAIALKSSKEYIQATNVVLVGGNGGNGGNGGKGSSVGKNYGIKWDVNHTIGGNGGNGGNGGSGGIFGKAGQGGKAGSYGGGGASGIGGVDYYISQGPNCSKDKAKIFATSGISGTDGKSDNDYEILINGKKIVFYAFKTPDGSALSYDKAVELASTEYNAKLVSIHSQEEQEAVYTLVKRLNVNCWLGLVRRPGTITYDWADGGTMIVDGKGSTATITDIYGNSVYANWEYDEPSNTYSDTKENCGGMYCSSGEWNDYSANSSSVCGFVATKIID